MFLPYQLGPGSLWALGPKDWRRTGDPERPLKGVVGGCCGGRRASQADSLNSFAKPRGPGGTGLGGCRERKGRLAQDLNSPRGVGVGE